MKDFRRVGVGDRSRETHCNNSSYIGRIVITESRYK